MARATFRFYAGLNDFLQPTRRQRGFDLEVHGRPVGELIEELGVPLSEVRLVLVNSEPASLLAQVPDGGRVSVYPALQSLQLVSDAPRTAGPEEG